MVYKIFQYDLEPVLFQRIIIGFKAILKSKYYLRAVFNASEYSLAAIKFASFCCPSVKLSISSCKKNNQEWQHPKVGKLKKHRMDKRNFNAMFITKKERKNMPNKNKVYVFWRITESPTDRNNVRLDAHMP